MPSLALGTSPVTLKEMVSAYSTIANNGGYIEPLLVTAVEDRNGKVLEAFQAQPPEQAMSLAHAQTLVDVMRGVIDKGTGAAIRSRFGIQADVAGKTGTTQDNTDGWFILMHPQLVAGAWVGFNDNRVTMGDYWGPGARSALPIVGDFFAQSLRTRVIDQQARFSAPQTGGMASQVNDWFSSLFPSSPPQQPTPVPDAEVILVPEPAPPPTPPAPPTPSPPPSVLVLPNVPSQAGSPGATDPRFVFIPSRPVAAPDRGGIPILRKSTVPENAGTGQ